MTLFPERQEAVKVLYQAAGRLLDNAAEVNNSISRERCRQVADRSVELAEKIAKMGPVMIKPDRAAAFEVEDIPFSVGYVVRVNENP